MFCFSIMLEGFLDLEIASGSQETSKGTSLESSLKKETYKIIVYSAICTFEKNRSRTRIHRRILCNILTCFFSSHPCVYAIN